MWRSDGSSASGGCGGSPADVGTGARGPARLTDRGGGGSAVPLASDPLRGEWCNRQHSRFWFCYSGFDSLLPSSDGRPPGRPSSFPGWSVPGWLLDCFGYSAPSSSGLGHHPLKVAARVRIPLGLLIKVQVRGTLRSVSSGFQPRLPLACRCMDGGTANARRDATCNRRRIRQRCAGTLSKFSCRSRTRGLSRMSRLDTTAPVACSPHRTPIHRSSRLARSTRWRAAEPARFGRSRVVDTLDTERFLAGSL